MKHPPMDLSRFEKCKLKKPAICDLLMVPEFKQAVDVFDGEITDEWIVRTVLDVQERLKGTRGYYNVHRHERAFRHQYGKYYGR